MAYSQVTYTGDGTTTNYTFPFPYISTVDVLVYVAGVSVPFTFLNPSAIACTTTPTAGAAVTIKRQTQKIAVPVNFTDGATLLKSDLDRLATYTLYSAQESDDTAASALRVGLTADFTARSLHISDLAPGVLPTDAVNKAQNDAIVAATVSAVAPYQSSAVSASATAVASAASAGSSATAATNSSAQATASAAAAALSAASAATLPVVARTTYIVGLSAGAVVGQTVFPGLTLAVGNVDVFYNGLKLLPGTDFNNTATTLTLARPAANLDTIEITSISAPLTVVDCGTY